MDNVKKMRLNAENVRKLNAFSIFKEKGESAVKSMFPEYLDFVKKRKNKSKDQVSKQLNDLVAVH